MPCAVRLFCFLPRYIAYDAAWRWQRDQADAVGRGEDEALALLEHEPVYTFGRRARHEHLLLPEASLRAAGAEVIESDRGGDVTYHGPGQLVAYPILTLKARRLGAGDYVCALEETVICTLARFGIAGERVAGRPGVWACGAKIASVGVRVAAGVSTHGLALNVATDLSRFDAIIPCGLRDACVTSIAHLTGVSPSIEAVSRAIATAFAEIFDSELVLQPAPTVAEAFQPPCHSPENLSTVRDRDEAFQRRRHSPIEPSTCEAVLSHGR